jgi:predicted RNase H-like HicB family nuclease
MSNFVAFIHKDTDTGYGVSFPNLPGCITVGRTLEEARSLAIEALALHIAGMNEDGTPVPAPSSMDQLVAEYEAEKPIAMLLITAGETSKSVRVNISMPEDMLRKVDHYAESHGYTRSGLLISAVRKVIEAA